MENTDRVPQFMHELDGLITRHGLENSLTYAELAGCLVFQLIDLWAEAQPDIEEAL